MVENNLGAKAREKRKMLGMTLKDLASVLDISFDYLSKIETGKRDPDPRIKKAIEKWVEVSEATKNVGDLYANLVVIGEDDGDKSTQVEEPPGPYGTDARFQVVRQIEPKKEKASSPLAAAILALVEAMTPDQQAAELKRLTDQFTASQTTEKS